MNSFSDHSPFITGFMTNFESYEITYYEVTINIKRNAPSATLQEMYLLHNYNERSSFIAGDRETG